jgi:suppressor for copper-sensitivity B
MTRFFSHILRSVAAPVFALALFMQAAPTCAQSPAAPPEHVKVRLFSPVTATGSDKTVPIGLSFAIDPEWDTYWRTPGDAGLAPAFDWKGSQNFADAAVYWPAPKRQVISGIDNIIYADNVTFPLTVKLQRAGEALSLHLKLDLLVCHDICVPESHTLDFTLPAGTAAPSADAGLYRAALATLPKKAADVAGFHFDKAWVDVDPANKNYLVVTATLPGPASADADLFVEDDAQLTFGKPDITTKDGTTAFRAEIHAPGTTEELRKSLSDGALTLTFIDGDSAVEGSLHLGAKPGDAAAPPAPIALKEKIEGLDLNILMLALLGGLILNLMPCVLPVLSLKVLSVVSHGGKDSKAAIFKNFMASSLGIIASFWLMAGALVALKDAGQSIGWGIQFQHPAFLLFLIVVLLLFAANMWGLFEIPLPRFIARTLPARQHDHEPTFIGHFLTGAFATLLATPCSAPFLGTAIGFALSRGAVEIFAIFTFLGLGLALPYILLAVSPRLFKYMPKPGKWMLTLKKALAVVLLLTAVWLVHVLVVIRTMPTLDAGWQKFDAALIAPAVADGKTVVVDVTADWCLTCKANKKFVLEQEDVEEALSADNILRLQADWTHHDEKIAAYLKSFGRYGIPFNVVYGPGAPGGIALPELLTRQVLLDAIDQAGGE